MEYTKFHICNFKTLSGFLKKVFWTLYNLPYTFSCYILKEIQYNKRWRLELSQPANLNLNTAFKTQLIHFIWLKKQSPEVFCKKSVLRNFTKFTGKHLCQSLFFTTLLKKRLWHRCSAVTFVKFLRTPF